MNIGTKTSGLSVVEKEKRKREKEKKKRTHCWVKEVFTATFGNGFEAVEFACNKSP